MEIQSWRNEIESASYLFSKQLQQKIRRGMERVTPIYRFARLLTYKFFTYVT